LARYPSRFITLMMWSRVSAFTSAGRDITRETVALDTPASRATSFTVGLFVLIFVVPNPTTPTLAALAR
jgi:hypothetical protein